MFKQWLKIGFPVVLVGVLMLMFIPKTYGAEYAEHEITFEKYGTELVSEPIFEESEFSAVAVRSEAEVDGLMVNFGNGWEDVDIHDDGYGQEALVFTSPTHTVQFKKVTAGNVPLKIFIFFNESDQIARNIGGLQASTQVALSELNIIPRSEWGADETMRYWNPDAEENDGNSEKDASEDGYTDPCADFITKYPAETSIAYIKDTSPGGDILIWPLQYAKTIRKFVVHHTDSEIKDLNGDNTTNTLDYRAIVRAIYRYHTITRGWGDIGYNYLIDPVGNIYEGRYGGDKVIGAHTLCHNNGTLGIAIIGNYEDDKVPEPALRSLISLIAFKGKQYNVDPDSTSSFRGKDMANVLGHKDLRATSCPGKNLYSLLPDIRERAALTVRSGTFREGSLQAENLDYNAEAQDDFGNITIMPNERKTIEIRFKNTGKQSWDQNTWLHVALNNNPNARVVPAIEDKPFVAADLRGRSVPPGETGTFETQIEGGYFPGTYNFEVSLVVNGRYKVSRAAIDLTFTVEKPVMTYEVVSSELPSGTIFQGQKMHGVVELKNTGNVVWKNYGDNKITLGTSAPRDRKSIFAKGNQTRIGYMQNSEIMPGQIGRFILELEAPEKKVGDFAEQFTPVIENVGWLEDKSMVFRIALKKPSHVAAMTKIDDVTRMTPGEMREIKIKVQNKGDLPWDTDNMQITLVGNGIKVFKNKIVPLETISKGQSAEFSFWTQAPYKEGTYSIYLRSRFNNTAIRDGNMRYAITVPKPIFRAQLSDQGDQSVTIRPNQEKESTVKFKNTGNIIWRNKGSNAIYLGSAMPQDRLSSLYYKDGWENKFRPATLEEAIVMPGETGTFKFSIKPTKKGIYKENFQLVIEGVSWIPSSEVNWTFRVFGESADGSNDLAVYDANKQRAALITTGKTAAQTQTTSQTTTTTKPVYTAPASAEKPFRVRLSYNDGNSTITANKNFLVTNGSGTELFTLSSGATVGVMRLGNNIHVQVGNVSKSASVIRFVPEAGGITEIKTWEHRPEWNQDLNDNKFREIIEIRVINDETAYINELPLEDYLKGLGEVSNDSPFEKQKAIAVLARTYARFYMDSANRKFPGLPYDGSDDPAIFQKYLGYGMEARSPNFAGAVAITKDEVVTYQGALVKTPYFNQSDGRTRSAQEVWGWTNTPYLVSVADPWCAGMTKSGHGVGLSGYGATKQAEEGKTYDEIIKYYYQGVAVQEMDF